MSEQQTTPAEVPTDIGEVSADVTETLLTVWADFVDHIPFLVAAVLALIATWGAAWLVQTMLGRALRRSKLRGSMQDLLLRLASIAVWTIGILISAMVVFPGLTPAKALGAMGLVSIAVGFAFKDIFENFFAGVLLLWRFPFENGDFVRCEGWVGRVEDVTVRMSRIRKTSGELVVVPNSFLFKNPVEVLTALDKRRTTIVTGVAYDVPLSDALKVIEDAVKRCETVKRDERIDVFASGFGSSSIDIEVTWWTGPTPYDVRRSVSEVVVAVKRALDDAGMEIPFPYRTLTFKEPLALANKQERADSPLSDESRAASPETT